MLPNIDTLSINNDATDPPDEQLADQLAAIIGNGKALKATPLPTCGELAAKLSIEPLTVELAYSKLMMEGFIKPSHYEVR